MHVYVIYIHNVMYHASVLCSISEYRNMNRIYMEYNDA